MNRAFAIYTKCFVITEKVVHIHLSVHEDNTQLNMQQRPHCRTWKKKGQILIALDVLINQKTFLDWNLEPQ